MIYSHEEEFKTDSLKQTVTQKKIFWRMLVLHGQKNISQNIYFYVHPKI